MFTTRYGKTIASCAVLGAFALFLTLVLSHAGPAKPRPAPRPQAGSAATREAVKPGNYATAINIHNPDPLNTVMLYKKAIRVAPEDANPFVPSPFKEYRLPPDLVVEIDCQDIVAELLNITPPNFNTTFYGGYVVIFASGAPSPKALPAPMPLDVVGVYTAEPPRGVPGIALQIVPIARESSPYKVSTKIPPPGSYYEYSAKFLCGTVPVP
jgi:hypothetical protein